MATNETNQDYESIERPYNHYLERTTSTESGVDSGVKASSSSTINEKTTENNTSSAEVSGGTTSNGGAETMPVKSDGGMSDLWITNLIRSTNWKPKTTGFYIDGLSGYAEFSNVYVSGNIRALTGSIGGFEIGSDYVRDTGDTFGLSSTVTGDNDVRLWAGASFANRGSAPFRVYEDGSIAGISITVSEFNIPDSTTANSFHADSSGNTWWGSNVSVGYSGANAYVLNTGSAVFKDIQMGGDTIQYVITNSGIFSFGDGSDGTATCDGVTAVTGMSLVGSIYTMTRDVYFDNLTIDAGISVKPGGYRIFVKGILTVNGTVDGSGEDGGDGGAGSINNNYGDGYGLGGAGKSYSDGYLKGSVASGAGGNGGCSVNFNPTEAGSPGGDGNNTTNSLGSNAGGTAGNGGRVENLGGVAGTAGTATGANVSLIANWHLATLLDISSTGATIKFDNSASGAGGGGGASGGASEWTSGTAGAGGGGGAGGGIGRIVAIYARKIILGPASSLTVNGGDGGDGGRGGDAGQIVIDHGYISSGGGGGGGAGGNGGVLIYVYNVLVDNGGTITASAGAGGAAGDPGTASEAPFNPTGSAISYAGVAGTAGSPGSIYSFQLSL